MRKLPQQHWGQGFRLPRGGSSALPDQRPSVPKPFPSQAGSSLTWSASRRGHPQLPLLPLLLFFAAARFSLAWALASAFASLSASFFSLACTGPQEPHEVGFRDSHTVHSSKSYKPNDSTLHHASSFICSFFSSSWAFFSAPLLLIHSLAASEAAFPAFFNASMDDLCASTRSSSICSLGAKSRLLRSFRRTSYQRTAAQTQTRSLDLCKLEN